MPTDPQTLLQLQVPVIVEIGRTALPVEEVLSLSPGSIIELAKPSDSPLDLLVNNKPIATGGAVKVAEKFGIRVEHIGSPRERIEAMGPDV